MTRIGLALVAALAMTLLSVGPARAQSYEERVRRGLDAVAHGDRQVGMTELRAAISENPSRPDALCYIAEAYRIAGDFAGALDNFQSCLRVARDSANLRFVGRALHGVASTFERMPEHGADARAAWLEYARFGDGAMTMASPEIGRERVQALDVMQEQERVYVEVRQRIAERERVAAQPAPTPAPSPSGRGGSRPH